LGGVLGEAELTALGQMVAKLSDPTQTALEATRIASLASERRTDVSVGRRG
jgi:hypothetical protein